MNISCFVQIKRRSFFINFNFKQEAWNITVSLLATGDHRIRLVLCWDVMVYQTKGTCVHICVHPFHTDIRCYVWFLYPAWTNLSWKVDSFHYTHTHTHTHTMLSLCYRLFIVLTFCSCNQQCPGIYRGYSRSVHSPVG